jgi:hypothetical protein
MMHYLFFPPSLSQRGKPDYLNFFSHLNSIVGLFFIYLSAFVFTIESFYLSARFDASRAHASALVHFAKIHAFLVVYRPVNLTVFAVPEYQTFYRIQYKSTLNDCNS